MRIGIVGGGIIGLSIGWQLAREKISVCIFDQKCSGKQASWSAAGMLSPYCEAIYGHVDLFHLGKASLSLYPSFLTQLHEDSPILIPKESKGTLYVAINRDDHEWLQRQYILKERSPMSVYWISGKEAREKEPLLTPKVTSALWIPSERQINNHLLLEALRDAFVARGGTLLEKVKIVEFSRERKNNNFELLAENGKSYFAHTVINTSGAWANKVDPFLIAQKINIKPNKGQLINLKMHSSMILQGMLRTPRIYFAPKKDQIVRVGATSEDLGFNEEITAGATLKLLENAWEAIPAISEYTIQGITVGFRPSTPHNMPFIGSSSREGLFHAIGHGRSGILLAPYTAYLVKKLLIKEGLYVHSA